MIVTLIVNILVAVSTAIIVIIVGAFVFDAIRGISVYRKDRRLIENLISHQPLPCPQCGGTGIDKPTGCICAVFNDTDWRIADLTCPSHGVGSGHPRPDSPWEPCLSCVRGTIPDPIVEVLRSAFNKRYPRRQI